MMQRRWWWALAPLLLATALVIPLLDHDAFNGDEPSSLLAAGVLRPGPPSLAAIGDQVHPQQALGWPLLLSMWGRVVGWSEPAIRALSLFTGLLALAWVYRAGRDLLAPGAGLCAALLLSVSAFLLTYMAHARVFTLVALGVALCLWSYWRVALHTRPPGLGAQAGLLLGASVLLWSHYFGALLLPVLGLYHLLFVPKNRRWWRPVLLTGLAALVAAAQLPVFLQGLDLTLGRDDPQDRALGATALLARLAHFMSNGLVDPSPPFVALLLILLPLALLVAGRRCAAQRGGHVWPLLFMWAALLTVMLAVNEWLRLIVPNAIRYLMPLWPLTALLAGAGLWRLARWQRGVAIGLLALWLVTGVHVNRSATLRYEPGYFFRSDFHHVYRHMRERIAASELLILDFPAAKLDKSQLHTRMLGAPWEIIYRYRDDPLDTVRHSHAAWPHVWLLYLTEHRAGFADFATDLGRVFCERALDAWGFTLERYALHSVEHCPELPARLEFAGGIRLSAPAVSIVDGTLRLDAHFYSEDEALLANYSLALHIIDPRSGARLAQGDTGVGPGRIVPLRSEIDLGALPAGEYALRVALYDWQTGERLPARDLQTGAVGELLTLQRFRSG